MKAPTPIIPLTKGIVSMPAIPALQRDTIKQIQPASQPASTGSGSHFLSAASIADVLLVAATLWANGGYW